jgi:hypothetical protein
MYAFDKKTEFTRVNGPQIIEKEKAWKGTQMVINMRATLRRERHRDEVSITGPTERFMTENGKPVSKTDTECGEVSLETHT